MTFIPTEQELDQEFKDTLDIYGEIPGINPSELLGNKGDTIDLKTELLIARLTLKTLLKGLNAEFNEVEYKKYVVDRLKWKADRASRSWNQIAKNKNAQYIGSFTNYHFASPKIAVQVRNTMKLIQSLCKQLADQRKSENKTIPVAAFAEVIHDLACIGTKYLKKAGTKTETVCTYQKEFARIVKDFQARNLS